MAINKTIIEDGLYTWLSSIISDPIIFANSSKPRQTGSYATINILTWLPIGTPGEELTSLPLDLVQIDYSQTYELLVSLNFFRDNSFNNASNVRDSIDLTTVQEQLRSAGLAFISTSDIRQITDVVKKSMEERYQFDVSFYTRSLTTEQIEQIKKIQVTNELDGTTVIVP